MHDKFSKIGSNTRKITPLIYSHFVKDYAFKKYTLEFV